MLEADSEVNGNPWTSAAEINRLGDGGQTLPRAGWTITCTTVIHDWGEESYVRRAGSLIIDLQKNLLAKVPSPAPNTRFYFHDVPSEVGFLIGDGPSLRVWYGDATLKGGYYRDFRVRKPGTPLGEDRFFRFAPGVGWVEIIAGPHTTFHLGWWEMGGEFLPQDHIAGLALLYTGKKKTDEGALICYNWVNSLESQNADVGLVLYNTKVGMLLHKDSPVIFQVNNDSSNYQLSQSTDGLTLEDTGKRLNDLPAGSNTPGRGAPVLSSLAPLRYAFRHDPLSDW